MNPNPNGPGLPRRDFLKLSGLAATSLALGGFRTYAGPFTAADFTRLIPADKKLDPAWVKSLFERGEPTVFRGAALDKIGMPIGGICAGGMYLSGDGRLWLWDIFNRNQEGIDPRGGLYEGKRVAPRNGGAYVAPPDAFSPLQQGFALQTTVAGKTETRPLDRTGWADTSFIGQYPIGQVTYRDPAAPVHVHLEAFSPFIPLDADDSGLPATILNFTITNPGTEPVHATLAGWLENAVCRRDKKTSILGHHNQVVTGQGFVFLNCAAETMPTAAGTPAEPDDIKKLADFGTMGLALLPSTDGESVGTPSLAGAPPLESVFTAPALPPGLARPLTETFIGGLRHQFTLAPGASTTISFVLTWNFPNTHLKLPDAAAGRYYAKRFPDAQAVAAYVAENFDHLCATTRLWRDTWYDSTLPHWFLDRTFANTSTLATTTAHRFGTGRFYAWEGVGCCPGTCTHVWHYAQAMGRLFPELERDTRERVDFGLALNPEGKMGFRAEFDHNAAVDGQAGRILGVYREYQMSADDAFLRRVWPKVKLALGWLIQCDGTDDGILQGPQGNTLDAEWYGQIPWLSSLYIAALRATEQMALDLGEPAYAARCRQIAEAGAHHLETTLFNGEYFFQTRDEKNAQALGTYDCCHIDQVMGQSWAWQVNLGRILDRDKTLTALRSLWKYNFTPDVGPWRKTMTAGRWYALPGDGGLVMTTNPRALPNPFGTPNAWQVGYFNECMSGFEHQVASHLVAEGMVLEGLAVTRAIHDRYTAKSRNPWNEIECSDHYARAMASYGTFISACGFEYHGPKGHLGFAPRLTPENFKCPFTTAAGWGTYAQTITAGKQTAAIELKWGTLELTTLTLALPENVSPAAVTATLAGQSQPLTSTTAANRLTLTFPTRLKIQTNQKLEIAIS